MTNDFYTRSKLDARDDRRRTAWLLSALALACLIWWRVHFPLQRWLAAGSIGDWQRETLILDTINTIDPPAPHSDAAPVRQPYWASRTKTGPPLFALIEYPVVNSTVQYAQPWRQIIFDERFRRVTELTTSASLSSTAVDRDHDGAVEVVMSHYADSRGMVVASHSTWLVLRLRQNRIELVGLFQFSGASPTVTQHCALRWRAAEDYDGTDADIFGYTYRPTPGGSYAQASNELHATLRWNRSGGVLRLVRPHARVNDCMPGDDPIVLPTDGKIDPVIKGLVDDALRKLQPPPGSQPATAPIPPPPASVPADPTTANSRP